MTNLYHYHLKIPVEFSTTFVDDRNLRHTAFDINLINPELRNWLAEHNLYILGYCERFLFDPVNFPSLLIHIDNPDSKNHVKLNYVFCDTPHQTVWYQLKPGKELKFSETAIGTRYAWAMPEDCEPVYSATLGQPSLINASILHGVSPVSSQRITYSMTLAKISTNELVSWEEAEDIFKDCY